MNPALFEILGSAVVRLLPLVTVVGGTVYILNKVNDLTQNVSNNIKADKTANNAMTYEYQYALRFFKLFSATTIEPELIFRTIREVNNLNLSWNNIFKYYADITVGKEFYGDCYAWRAICEKHYDNSGQFMKHLAIALNETDFIEAQKLMYG